MFVTEQAREGSREVTEAPPHTRLMREQEIADYEPASDPGNFRWYPKGSLMKQLLEQHVSRMVVDYGAMQVETPIMYDYEHPQLAAYLNRFPARQYILRSDRKEYFMRFAACFGQYMIQHDMQLSYRNLPCRMYELTHYSFRREQTGELDKLLLKIADNYDDEVDTALEGVVNALEPLMIVVLGVIIGSIVIALFLPLATIFQHGIG